MRSWLISFTPKVSIVLPVFNQESFLVDCLKSIEQQTLTDWELIAVDDHSSDHSIEILHNWAQKDYRIKIFRNPGKGISDALNYGISQSNAWLIARMDGDDLMPPKRLAVQVRHLENHPELGLVSCQSVHFPKSENNTRKGYELYVEWSNGILSHSEHKIYRFVDCLFAHPSVVFRKELIFSFGGYQKGEIPEDFELWLRWLSKGVKMEKIPQKLLFWRDHPERASRILLNYNQNSFHQVKALYLYKWIRDECKINGRKIVCWGAGRVARKLISKILNSGLCIDQLIDIDQAKIGKNISSIPIISENEIPSPRECFVLILIGARGARKMVSDFLENKGFLLGRDFLPLE